MVEHDFGETLIFVSVNNDVLCNNDTVYIDLNQACRQEEADTKVIVHVSNCLSHGFRSISVKTVDTDVVTLILAHPSVLPYPNEIEVDFGFGKKRKYYGINEISEKLSLDDQKGILFFHAFTESDMTISFFKITKPTRWKLWRENTFISKTFCSSPQKIEEVDFENLERFVCIAYDMQNRFSTHDVNKLRHLLFLRSSENNLRKLRPLKNALRLHIQRSAYVAGWNWGTALRSEIPISFNPMGLEIW